MLGRNLNLFGIGLRQKKDDRFKSRLIFPFIYVLLPLFKFRNDPYAFQAGFLFDLSPGSFFNGLAFFYVTLGEIPMAQLMLEQKVLYFVIRCPMKNYGTRGFFNHN